MSLDWGELFRFDVGALELFVRTSIVYLALLAVLRVIARREIGSLELPELLMIVLVADGVQNGMAGEYESISGALVVAGTLIGWNYFLDWLAFRSLWFRRLIRPAPLKLVENGRMLRRNMRKEMISEDELRYNLRVQGIEDLSEAKLVCMEPDGELSVVKADGNGRGDEQGGPKNRRRTQGAA